MNLQGKRYTIRGLWEARTDTIHITEKERKRGKKPTKNKTPTSQNTSAFGRIKQWLPPMQFTSAASVGTTTIVKIEKFTHTLFTQGINGIAEELHCKNHSWLQPQMPCLNSKIKMPKRRKYKTGQMSGRK